MMSPSTGETQVETGLQSPVLRSGIFTGVLLTAVMAATLLVANRVPSLEGYAFLRNVFCCALIALIMLIPVVRFYHSPKRLFASAIIGWALFAIAYDFAGVYFTNLNNRLNRTTFELFVLGAVVYGVVAVLAWVIAMVFLAIHHPVAHTHRRVKDNSPR